MTENNSNKSSVNTNKSKLDEGISNNANDITGIVFDLFFDKEFKSDKDLAEEIINVKEEKSNS